METGPSKVLRALGLPLLSALHDKRVSPLPAILSGTLTLAPPYSGLLPHPYSQCALSLSTCFVFVEISVCSAQRASRLSPSVFSNLSPCYFPMVNPGDAFDPGLHELHPVDVSLFFKVMDAFCRLRIFF